MSAKIPCAKCTTPLRPGARQCAACGSPAVVLVTESTDATCAVHRDRLPNGVCTRCGAFACSTCLMRSRDTLVCLKCAPVATPAGVPLEDRQRMWFMRVLATWWRFMVAPGDSAARVGEGGLLVPLLFSFGCWCVSLLSWSVLVASLGSSFIGESVVVGLVLGGACFFAWSFVMPWCEWVVLRAASIPISLRALMRVGAFTSAPWAVPLCGCLPLGVLAVPFRVIAFRRALRLSWFEACLAVGTAPLLLVCGALVARADLLLWA